MEVVSCLREAQAYLKKSLRTELFGVLIWISDIISQKKLKRLGY